MSTNAIEKKVLKIARVVSSPMSFISLMPVLRILYENPSIELHLIAKMSKADEEELKNKLPLAVLHSVSINREISLLNDFKSLILLSYIFIKNQIDIVHSHTPKAGLVSAVAAFLSFRKIRIHTFTGQVWVGFFGKKKFFFKTIDKLIVDLNTLCYVDGNSQKDFLALSGIGKKGRLKVLGQGSLSGLDTERFNPVDYSATREPTRRGLFGDGSYDVLLFIGRINKDKGIEELLTAFDVLEKEFSLKLLLVGPIEKIDQIWLEKIVLLKGENKLVHIDFTLNVESYYAASDLFCLPTYREGCPVSVLEASSMELPVVSTNIYGVRDTMIDGHTGLLCEPKDADSLTVALRRILEDKVLAKTFGRNGRVFVQKNFKVAQIADELMKDYFSL